jgi:hypothetical protein
MNNFVIKKLTELLIKQSIKDKQEQRVECISKVEAYKGLIKLLKEAQNG